MRASWREFASRRGVELVVALPPGQTLTSTGPALRAFLNGHRDPNVPLAIVEAIRVPITFQAAVRIEPGVLASRVEAAARAAAGPETGFFSFSRLAIGQEIHLSELVTALQGVAGVEWVNTSEFHDLARTRTFPVPAPGEPWGTGQTIALARKRDHWHGLPLPSRILRRHRGGGVMNPVPLYELLPEYLRAEDEALRVLGAAGPPLRALLRAAEIEGEKVYAAIAAQQDAFFAETCPGWALPYLADLIGLDVFSSEPGSIRREVARTIGYRRRKGDRAATGDHGW